MSVCREMLSTAMGREVSQGDADRLFKRIGQRADALRAADPSLGYNDALAAVAKEFTDAGELKLIVQKRNAIINQLRTMEGVDYLNGTWADDPGTGLKAILVGVQSDKRGARSSIGADQDAIMDQYTGGLIADVSKTDGGLDALVRGDMDDDLARVLWELSDGGDVSGFSKAAQDVGAAIRKWQEYARVKANEAGAWIGKANGYITSTFHDSVRIAKNQDGWMESALANFDLARMADEMEVDVSEMPGILASIGRNFADGVHLKLPEPGKTVAKGVKGIGRKLSHDRVIHFKDADAWSRYNADFGAGNMREAVMHGLRRQAQATAMMNTLGPNYEQTFDAIVEQTLRSMKERQEPAAKIAKLAADARSHKRLYLSHLDGSLDIPGNDMLATVAGSVRSVQSMASLGGMTLSSVSDTATIALGAKYNGLSGLQMIGKGVGNLFGGVPNAEKLELYADLGLALTSLSGKLAHGRFTPGDDVRGMMGALQQKFFTLTLQNRWTDSFRESIAEALSANLARRAGDAFDALPDRLRTTLNLYGIDADKWDIFRRVPQEEFDGSRFVSPKMMDELDDAPFEAYLSARDLKPTPARVRDLRSEIQRQFRAYFSDQNQYMLLTPDAGTVGMMKQGTQKGTGIGEAVRFIMQFKSFPLAFTQKIIGRELKQGGIVGVSQMIALTMVAGYASSVLKDLAKGKVPRDPTDWRTAVAALQQGGGLGLYGDVLFSQILDRRFGDAAAQLLGPTFSDVFGSQGLSGLAARAAQGEDFGPAALRFVQGNTPFLNLFYTKMAMDYLIFYRIQEWMNPGSLARMEGEMQQRTGQEFIAPPSETVN